MTFPIRYLTRTLLGAVCWLAGTAAVAAPAPGPPPEAFGTLPVESNVVMSPNGRWLAWMERKGPAPHVIMFDLDRNQLQRTLAVSEGAQLRSLLWNDDETLLITASEPFEVFRGTEAGVELFVTVAQDVGGGVGRMLPASAGFGRGSAARATLVSARTTKPKAVIMLSYSNCKQGVRLCLVEVDARTGASTMVAAGTDLTTAWVVNRDGQVLAREDWDWRQKAYRISAVMAEHKIREIYRKDDTDRPILAGLLPDASAVVVLAANERGNQAAWAVPLDGSPTRLLVEDPADDITGVYRDSNTGSIVGAYVGGAEHKITWLEPSAQKRFDALQRSFVGRDVHVYGWTEDGSKTLAKVQTPSIPPVYYVVDFKAHRADIAAEEYPQLANVRLGNSQQITYAARDGTSIVAYLTTPPDQNVRPVPLVVLPHDGPQSRDYPVFDWLVQFLATRGYAVLQPQFRGSVGFGVAFREAGYKQWGGLMQDDLTDGVRAMIDQGIADPHKICIVGEGYGGYAALAGAAFTPDLYACAASINGISDLAALMRDATDLGRRKSTLRAALEARIGPWNSDLLSAKSPINAAAAVTAPVLIVYGTGVGSGDHDQSERMAKALKARGKDVTVVELPGLDHWRSRTDTRVQVLEGLEGFLKAHL